MGDCLIVRRGGVVFKLPTLNPALPADLAVKESSLMNAGFSVEIQTSGIPARYTYQWYLDGSPISGATGASCVINQGVSKGSHFVYCKVTNEAGTVVSRSAVFTVDSHLPKYIYSGMKQIIDEGNFNWKLNLLSSGTLLLNEDIGKVDVFLVGAGGGGGATNANERSGGGGGGYTTTTSVTLPLNQPVAVTIGGGSSGAQGGTSSLVCASTAINVSANGGQPGICGGSGGDGGSGGGGSNNANGSAGPGGSNGSSGTGGTGGDGKSGGQGQGRTTREFGEPSGALYAGGGGGGFGNSEAGRAGGEGGGGVGGGWDAPPPTNGEANTGGGAGGNGYGTKVIAAGGSGIIIIRNHRG